ncbi:heterokaryon incompatibility protein [Botrytis cinerea]
MPLFSTEIPLKILPQTLYDAVMLTRKLGEHYIWIDSMCILQDSGEDWQFEASNMASIYGSAVMTIVAASSSVYGGITNRRNPLRNSAASLDLQDGNKSNPNTRSQGLEQLIKHPPYRWYTLWYRLIEQYSNKSLTYPKDRLLAFYGIACDKAGDAYLAGLLKTDPWASLLWCRDENQIQRRPGHRYKEYVAPSWSWASIDAPVLFYEANARHWRKPQLGTTLRDPELIHAEAQPVSYFKTGAVKSGSVEISAYIIMARTAPVEPFLFNTRQGSHTYGRRNCVDPLTGDALGLIVFDVALEAQDDMLLCCALLQTGNMDLWEKNGTAGLGLALKVEGATAKHWKCARVGYVQFTSVFGRYAQKYRVKIS